MARTYSLVDSGNTTTDATSFVTSSFTPADNSLIIILFMNTKTTLPNSGTPSGFGLTWNLINSIEGVTTGSPRVLVTAHYAQANTGHSSSAITVSFGATQSGFAYAVVQVTDHDTGSPITQSATNNADSASSFNVTLGSALGSDPLAIAAFGMATTTTVTHEWSTLTTQAYTSPARTFHVVDSTTSDLSANITTLSAATDICGLIIEVSKVSATTGQPMMLRQLQIPFTSTIKATHALRL